ncbi:MAG: hybrid sensor histidine kinase/response regulator [Marivirga sp.]|nr:hybrid sensor histidine kinase/response regulator [Marivirga sp.]
MKSSRVKVLLIEDDEDDVFLTKEYLSRIDNYEFEVDRESEPSSARQRILKGGHDIFLIDYRLGSESGLELIKFIQDKKILTPSIILTGQGDLKVDIDASSYGASDYLVKSDLNSSLLERSIRYAISQSKIVKELDEKEKKYRSLFERSIDPIFLATDKLVLTDVNDSFLKFFGYTDNEVDAITVDSIFARSEDYDYFRASLRDTQQIKDFELSLITRTGETKVCLLNCVYIPDQASEFCCYQGIIHDLTHRKQAERDMLIAERLSLTGKIARTIAHEVRNPLTNVNLALDQLRKEIPEDNDSAVLYGDIIERNVNRIEQLVGEMLNSSKPKELHLELVSMTDVLEETIGLALDRIKLNQMELQRHYPNDLPRMLIDKEKVKIALLNILINAIEAMTPGRGLLKIFATVNNGTLTLAIHDNGKGIPEADLGKLFDPFFTAKQSGMGLGLTSTKNILASHCAHIDVQSELNVGTTFYISFKLDE